MGKERIKCLICEKEVTNNGAYIGSHVKRVHHLLLNEYVTLYYKNLTNDFKIEKCGFCNNDAIPNYNINHIDKTYKLNYNGYFCETNECKNNISLKIFNETYNCKKFEHIGANSLYLSLLYKKSIKDVKYSKSKGFRECKFTCTLESFIKKYGEKEGLEKYKERNIKIGKGNTLLWYKEKYGEIKGIEKYDEYRKKMHRHFGKTKSEKSKIINKILDKNNIKYFEEYKYESKNKKNGAIDFFIPSYNIVIEYYGDYWHCNPSSYEKDYFHKICKRYAYEIWKKDKQRIRYIFEHEFKKNITILIIWESTTFSEEYLLNLLKEIQNKNTIIEI